MRLRALQSVVSARPVGSLGSPLPFCPRRFRRDQRSLPNAVPRSLAQTGSSSRELRSSSECCRPAPAPRLPAWSASLGVAVPLRDISQRRPTRWVSQTHRLAVLGVSHARDGLLRLWPCGFVSPHSHVQGSPFRGFPSRTVEAARRCRVPSRRLAKVRYQWFPTGATSLRPALRALLRARVRC